MTDPELHELASLWQKPDPAETARFEALARRARRQGRLLAYADLGLAVLIVGGTVLGTLVTPQPTTIAMALLLVAATVWLTWKRRKLRQMTAELNTSDPMAFLESSARNAAGSLRRVNLSLTLIPLFVVVAALFRASVRGGEHDSLLDGVWAWATSPRGMIALSIVAVVMVVMARSRKRRQEELRRLEIIRLQYEAERSQE